MSYPPSPRGKVPPPPPMRQNTERRAMPAPPPPVNNNLRQNHLQENNNMQSPLNRLSTIPVQSAYHSVDIDIPEPPQTEAGKWTFHSQKEFPPPPPFEKKLKRYPTGAETGCSIPIDLSHLQVYQAAIFIRWTIPDDCIALTRFGIYGNGATNKAIGEYFSIGYGSVDNYVEHFIVAVLKLQEKYIQWPMGRERERVILRHHELFGLPECIGFMDGSLFAMHQTPTWHNKLFWCRKHIHAIQCMVICDFDTRVLSGATGHYGSANNPGVLNQSGFLDKLDTFFEGEQYVVADLVYAKTEWCVPIGKNSEHEPLTGSDVKFNRLLSKARVSIESCFGALKGRFASLEELRCQLKAEEDDDPAFMSEIIDYFRRTRGENESLEINEEMTSRTSRSSKYGNFGTTDGSFAVPNVSTSEGIKKWLAVKKYVLDIQDKRSPTS